MNKVPPFTRRDSTICNFSLAKTPTSSYYMPCEKISLYKSKLDISSPYPSNIPTSIPPPISNQSTGPVLLSLLSQRSLTGNIKLSSSPLFKIHPPAPGQGANNAPLALQPTSFPDSHFPPAHSSSCPHSLPVWPPSPAQWLALPFWPMNSRMESISGFNPQHSLGCGLPGSVPLT